MSEAENMDTENLCGEPLQPLTLKRKLTDIPALVIFIHYIGLWIFVAVYAFKNGNVDINSNYINGSQHNHSIETHNHGIYLASFFATKSIILEFTLVPILLSIAFIMLSRLSARMLIYTLFQCIFIIVTLSGNVLIYSTTTDAARFFGIWSFTAVIWSTWVICSTYYFETFYERLKIAGKFIQGMATFTSYLPQSLLVPLIQCILYGIVTIFSVSIMCYLLAIPNENNLNVTTYLIVFHLINIFALLWIISFINGFAEIVLAGNFITWMWSKDEPSVPKYTLPHYVRIILRYHLGTVALGSLLAISFTFFRFLLNIFPSPFFLRFDNFRSKYERFDKFLQHAHMYAYIGSSIRGTNAIQSAKQAINIEKPDNTEYLWPDFILLMVRVSVIGFSTLPIYFYCRSSHLNNHAQFFAIASVIVLSSAMTWAFLRIFKVARDTLGFTMSKIISDDDFPEITIYSSSKMEVIRLSYMSNSADEIFSDTHSDEETNSDEERRNNMATTSYEEIDYNGESSMAGSSRMNF